MKCPVWLNKNGIPSDLRKLCGGLQVFSEEANVEAVHIGEAYR